MDHPRGLAVVTGASGGIGLELARLFAADGYPLLLAARSGGKLETIAADLTREHGVPASTCALDLSEPEAPPRLFEEIGRQAAPLECLVNNAGFATYGPFVEADLGTTLQLIRLNIEALTHLTRLALPGMAERRRGRVLNVASAAAFTPGPLMAVYYASKAYVLHFSEAIDEEMRGSGVTITALCPGPTGTGFGDRAGLAASKLFRGDRVMGARAVAELGYRGLMRGDRIVVTGLKNKLLVQSTRLLPRRLATSITRRMQARTHPGGGPAPGA